jgi:hypothetical protein
MSIDVRVETITPRMAANYLTRNTMNRPLRGYWVSALAKAIEDGRWHVTHQGIAFNCDGSLLDGQHRLSAIVAANKPVKMLVTRQLERGAMLGIDQGRLRTATDIAPTLGIAEEIGRDHVAIARRMRCGFGTQMQLKTAKWSNEEVIRYIVAHYEAIDYAAKTAWNTKHAAIRAVIARAHYSASHERLGEFCEVLRTGVAASPADSGAVLLKITFNRNRNDWGTMTGGSVLYAKAECCMRAFLNRRPITKVVAVESELFPIPSDEQE